MKHVLNILAVLVMTAGLTVGLGGMKNLYSSCPAPKDPQPAVDEEVSNNDDAFDERHDTFDIEELANNDDAFDERHDTFEIEDLA